MGGDTDTSQAVPSPGSAFDRYPGIGDRVVDRLELAQDSEGGSEMIKRKLGEDGKIVIEGPSVMIMDMGFIEKIKFLFGMDALCDGIKISKFKAAYVIDEPVVSMEDFRELALIPWGIKSPKNHPATYSDYGMIVKDLYDRLTGKK